MALLTCALLALPLSGQGTCAATILRTGGHCEALAVDGFLDKQYGRQNDLTAYWTGSPDPAAQFDPDSGSGSSVTCTFRPDVGGFRTINGVQHATTWHGGGTDPHDWDPGLGLGSVINGLSDDGMAGTVRVSTAEGIRPHAYRWDQRSLQTTDLHPGHAIFSQALGAAYKIQVGCYQPRPHPTLPGGPAPLPQIHACFWRSSASTFVDLSPKARLAFARAADGPTKVGSVDKRACRWLDTPASRVDLHPAGATESDCFGVQDIYQVGQATLSGRSHACIWTGLPGSFFDLHRALPPGYGTSRAQAVWIVVTNQTGSTYTFRIDVVGSATQTKHPGTSDAVLWRLQGTATDDKPGSHRANVSMAITGFPSANFIVDLNPKVSPPNSL